MFSERAKREKEKIISGSWWRGREGGGRKGRGKEEVLAWGVEGGGTGLAGGGGVLASVTWDAGLGRGKEFV